MNLPSDLALARKHVADAEQRIADQEARITRLTNAGQLSDMAEDLLRVLRRAHKQMQVHLTVLEEDERRKGSQIWR